MKRIIDFIKNISSTKEVRKKVLFTAIIFFVFRLLAHIPVPGVDLIQLKTIFSDSQFLSLLNIFSGGTLANFSIVAVGINSFITASIVIQMATMVFPALKEMQKEGESGKEKLNQYTRFLAVPLSVVQSISVLALLNSQNLLSANNPLQLIAMISTLVAGAMLTMWLGEIITIYGIGNGISMMLFAGILSQFPVAIAQTISVTTADQLTTMLVFLSVFVVVIAAMVFMNEAVRKVNIQYAKRIRGGRTFGGQTTHLPIRVNVAGVLPIIFAVSIMLVPSFAGRLLVAASNPTLIDIGRKLSIWFAQTSTIYMVLYFAIVFLFTYFSALIFFNAQDISDELKKSGAFLPGIRPGGPTKKYLEYVVTRITFVGAIFLGIVAILPSLAQNLSGVNSLAIGGTSVLIVVSVILETAKQIDGMLINQNYDKYL